MFEITEGLMTVAHGTVKLNEDAKLTNVIPPESDDNFTLLEDDFYKEMRLRGYHHKYQFRAVKESRDDGLKGKIQWNSEWTTFIDCLLQFQVLMKDTRMLVLPTKFRKLIINPLIHREVLSQSKYGLINAVTCPYSRIIQAG